MSRCPLLLVAGLGFALVAGAPVTVHADSDTELWSEISARHKLDRRWRLSLTQGLRMSEAGSRFADSLTDVGMTVRAARWLRLGAGYRLAYKQKRNDDMELRHRLDFDARAKLRAGKLSGFYRLRLQRQYRPDGTLHSLRNRIGVEYAASRRVAPFASAELFHLLDGKGDGVEVGKFRLTMGTSYDWRSRGLELFYRFEQPVADDNDPVVHIVGLGYKFSL